MQIREGLETEYQDYKKNNAAVDAYSARIVSYSEDWANLMETALANGKTVAECAEAASREADTDGITGFMYSCAAKGLSHFWIHGEALRQWHNLRFQIGNEGEKANADGTILNTAVLNVG